MRLTGKQQCDNSNEIQRWTRNYQDVLQLRRDVCFTFASEPHFAVGGEPEPADVLIESVRTYVEDGGNFLAECHAIESYENCDEDNHCADITCDPNYHDWYVQMVLHIYFSTLLKLISFFFKKNVVVRLGNQRKACWQPQVLEQKIVAQQLKYQM